MHEVATHLALLDYLIVGENMGPAKKEKASKSVNLVDDKKALQ